MQRRQLRTRQRATSKLPRLLYDKVIDGHGAFDDVYGDGLC